MLPLCYFYETNITHYVVHSLCKLWLPCQSLFSKQQFFHPVRQKSFTSLDLDSALTNSDAGQRRPVHRQKGGGNMRKTQFPSEATFPSEMSAPCDMPPSAPVYSHTGTVSPIMRRIMPNTAAGETRCLLSLGNNYWGVLCVPACPNYLSFIACHSKWARVRKRRREEKKPLQGGCVIIRGGTHWKFRVFLLLEKIGTVVWKGSSICMKFQAHL